VRNRWLIALCGTLLMACLGTVYSWSLFAQPLQAAFGWSATATTWAFALAILFLGVGAVLGGRWQDRVGPRRVALTGALLWGAGNLLAGLGTARLGAPWLYATYGVLGGLGLGLGYVTPVAAVTKWFPDRRGLGSGMVVMGFGLGAFLYNQLLARLPAFAELARAAGQVLATRAAGGAASLAPAQVEALSATFLASGAVFALLGGASAAQLVDPPAAGPGAPTAAGYTAAEAARTPQLWALFAMLFLNVTAGILFISGAVPIMRELTGAPATAAVATYGTIALANGLGRFFWGAVSDRIGRRAAYGLLYGAQVALFLAAGRAHSLGLVAGLFALVLLCYGGGFGVMPSFVADWFGTKALGQVYGLVLLAWGLAGVAGPLFAARVKDLTGSYAGALPVIAGLMAVATLLPILTRPPARPG
jgi:MFS family permease